MCGWAYICLSVGLPISVWVSVHDKSWLTCVTYTVTLMQAFHLTCVYKDFTKKMMIQFDMKHGVFYLHSIKGKILYSALLHDRHEVEHDSISCMELVYLLTPCFHAPMESINTSLRSLLWFILLRSFLVMTKQLLLLITKSHDCFVMNF